MHQYTIDLLECEPSWVHMQYRMHMHAVSSPFPCYIVGRIQEHRQQISAEDLEIVKTGVGLSDSVAERACWGRI